uniref:Uncharacterized protein n=1 Tax=Anguilla anguilla TaxID=7936 RepID=A0A0E9PDS8_ANGAN
MVKLISILVKSFMYILCLTKFKYCTCRQ